MRSNALHGVYLPVLLIMHVTVGVWRRSELKMLVFNIGAAEYGAKTVRAPDTMLTLSPLAPEAKRLQLSLPSERQAEVEQQSIHFFQCSFPLAR